ncbi:hypothetical protein HETIRDRAFT_117392 [Heterobasidion irregulare TC 32-1]|uniref:Uncharacterized protein n=1 Tax=Heterobasidion irregulare (strain TC 32-1) TaxID=747525 RepID=W4JYK4_HETIT|nr:uncharacterized protein HETIRDRAFT_117392 [Heterobasidion irregulare TC 32-1]ETW78529.1 hypothetical protein HETIRDRAFT_117392 [Heterobasidion irregulare TC 32-1]
MIYLCSARQKYLRGKITRETNGQEAGWMAEPDKVEGQSRYRTPPVEHTSDGYLTDTPRAREFMLSPLLAGCTSPKVERRTCGSSLYEDPTARMIRCHNQGGWLLQVMQKGARRMHVIENDWAMTVALYIPESEYALWDRKRTYPHSARNARCKHEVLNTWSTFKDHRVIRTLEKIKISLEDYVLLSTSTTVVVLAHYESAAF